MKLKTLHIQDCLVIARADVDLSRPMTLILGENGAGKSSIVDAMRWALTGRARCTDAAGRGARALIRSGAEDAIVGLEVEMEGKVRHIERRIATDGVSRVDQKDLADADLIDALLDMPRFLEMDPKKQGELLAGIVKLEVPLADIVSLARDRGLSVSAQESLDAGLRRLLADGQAVTPAILATAYERLYERRRDRKRDLDTLRKAAPMAIPGPTSIPTAEEIAAARQALAQAEAAKASANQAVGRAKADLSALDTLTDERRRVERLLAGLPAPAAQGDLGIGPDLAGLEAEGLRLAGIEQAAKADLDAAAKEEAEAAKEEAAAFATLKALERGSITCDGSFRAEKLACPIMEARSADRAKQVPTARKALDAAMAKLKATSAAEAVARRQWQESAATLDAARVAWQDAQRGAAKSSGAAEAQRAGLHARIGEIDAKLGTREALARALAGAETAVFASARTAAEAQHAATALEGVGQMAAAHTAHAEQLADATAEVEILEELVAALSPKALPAQLLEQRCGPFVSRVNTTLRALTGGEFEVRVRAEKGLALDVLRAADTTPFSPDLLSESERYRLGISLAAAISVATGLRILVIDRADILVGAPKGALSEAVLGLVESGDLESVVILASREHPYEIVTEHGEIVVANPLPESSEAMGVYWIEGGVVTAAADVAPMPIDEEVVA